MSFALQHGVPRSTARGWLAAPNLEVVSTDVLNMDVGQLQQEAFRLRTPVQEPIALLRVLLAVLRISRFSLNHSPLPDGDDTRHQLADPDIETIRDLVTSHEYRHVPIGTLANLAQRLDAVYRSESDSFLRKAAQQVKQHKSQLPHSAFRGADAG